MNSEQAAALAAEYYRIHNEAAKAFTMAFAAVGARMWRDDDARPLKPKSRAFIAEQMERMDAAGVRAVYPAAVTCPLTVLDAYPNVKAKERRALTREVRLITKEFNEEWSALLDARL